jgi:hypothetical protein
MTTRIDVKEFQKWATNALPGDRITYRTGRNTLSESQDPSLGLAGLMYRARSLSDNGTVALFQSTDGMGYYEYIAVRLSPQSYRFLEKISCKNKSKPL